MKTKFLESGTLISSKPGHVLIGFGKRTWLRREEQLPNPVFYFPDFFLKNTHAWFTHEEWCELPLSELQEFLAEIQTHPYADSVTWNLPKKELFENEFANLQKQFESKKLEKAVPYIFAQSTTRMTRNRLQQCLKSAVQYAITYPAHLYGFWDHSKGEGVLGVTPEFLFDLNSTLKSVACAGTYRSDLQDQQDQHKLLREHQIVVKGIQESLVNFGSVNVGKMITTNFGALNHFITPIEVPLQQRPEFDSIVLALHPTPALGAFPKQEGSRWLENYALKYTRWRYGAPVGYIKETQAKCLVAIRNVQWDEAGMYIGVGCGVVCESEYDSEYRELQLKLQSIKDLLSL